MVSKTTPKKGEMMDPNAREGAPPDIYKPTDRNTWGMNTLIAEVEALFPGVQYETSHRNKRGVAFDVQFDLSTIEETDREGFVTLMILLGDTAHNHDPRIEEIMVEGSEYVMVSFVNNPRIQDSRDPFRLADAWTVLNGDDL